MFARRDRGMHITAAFLLNLKFVMKLARDILSALSANDILVIYLHTITIALRTRYSFRGAAAITVSMPVNSPLRPPKTSELLRRREVTRWVQCGSNDPLLRCRLYPSKRTYPATQINVRYGPKAGIGSPTGGFTAPIFCRACTTLDLRQRRSIH